MIHRISEKIVMMLDQVQLIKIKSIFQKIEIAYHGKICQG